jgi:hypothetical protein
MAITLRSKSAQAFVKEMVHENWKTMREERSVLEQTWKRCLMAYLCEFDKAWVDYAKKAGRSHRYVAISWDSVETITPQIYDTIFGSENSLKVRPIREGGMSESDDDLATQMRYLLRHQMMYGKYQRTAQMAIKQMLILGNCPWTMAWKTIKAPDYGHFTDAMKRWMEQAAAHQAEFNDLTATYQAVALRAQLLGAEPPPPPEIAPPPAPPRELDTIFAGPVLRIGSIFNYVQEQHPNDDIGSIRVMRSFRTLQYLKALAKPDPKTGYVLYENLDLVKPDRSEEGTGDNDAEILMKMAVGMTLPHGKDKIEVKEQHGTIEIPSGPDAGLYENYVAVTFNDELVRLEPSPLFSNKPLVQNARLTIFEGAVYGVGIIEKSLSEQDTVNAVHNQNIDATNSVIQPEYEVVEENLAEPMKPSGPGARHKVHAGKLDHGHRQELQRHPHRRRGRPRVDHAPRADHGRREHRPGSQRDGHAHGPQLERHRHEARWSRRGRRVGTGQRVAEHRDGDERPVPRRRRGDRRHAGRQKSHADDQPAVDQARVDGLLSRFEVHGRARPAHPESHDGQADGLAGCGYWRAYDREHGRTRPQALQGNPRGRREHRQAEGTVRAGDAAVPADAGADADGRCTGGRWRRWRSDWDSRRSTGF